jgi:hypothetical protein
MARVAEGPTRAKSWQDFVDLRQIPWRAHDLAEGESVTGRVVRLPKRGAFNGSRVFIATRAEIVGLHATAKTGHTVLERQLKGIGVGDLITIINHGLRMTRDGERYYRHYEVVRR